MIFAARDNNARGNINFTLSSLRTLSFLLQQQMIALLIKVAYEETQIT